MAHFHCSFVLFVLLLACGTQARQLRYNRYAVDVEEEEEGVGGVEATVREVQPAPYPAAGYRPGRAFRLPGEANADEEDGSSLSTVITTTTTDWPEQLITTTSTSTSTSTDNSVLETTTIDNEVPAALSSDDAAKQGRAAKAPYPAAGYRPSKAFHLPNEIEVKFSLAPKADAEVMDAAGATTTVAPAEAQTDLGTAAAAPTSLPKAPYPAAGYRPSKAFSLPNDVPAENRISVVAVNEPEPEPEPPVSPADKAGHPACGVSDNPPAPKPQEGAAEDPDAERVFVTANFAPAVVTAPGERLVTLRAQPLIAQPLYIAARLPFAYSAQVHNG